MVSSKCYMLGLLDCNKFSLQCGATPKKLSRMRTIVVLNAYMWQERIVLFLDFTFRFKEVYEILLRAPHLISFAVLFC